MMIRYDRHLPLMYTPFYIDNTYVFYYNLLRWVRVKGVIKVAVNLIYYGEPIPYPLVSEIARI